MFLSCRDSPNFGLTHTCVVFDTHRSSGKDLRCLLHQPAQPSCHDARPANWHKLKLTGPPQTYGQISKRSLAAMHEPEATRRKGSSGSTRAGFPAPCLKEKFPKTRLGDSTYSATGHKRPV